MPGVSATTNASATDSAPRNPPQKVRTRQDHLMLVARGSMIASSPNTGTARTTTIATYRPAASGNILINSVVGSREPTSTKRMALSTNASKLQKPSSCVPFMRLTTCPNRATSSQPTTTATTPEKCSRSASRYEP